MRKLAQKSTWSHAPSCLNAQHGIKISLNLLKVGLTLQAPISTIPVLLVGKKNLAIG